MRTDEALDDPTVTTRLAVQLLLDAKTGCSVCLSIGRKKAWPTGGSTIRWLTQESPNQAHKTETLKKNVVFDGRTVEKIYIRRLATY